RPWRKIRRKRNTTPCWKRCGNCFGWRSELRKRKLVGTSGKRLSFFRHIMKIVTKGESMDLPIKFPEEREKIYREALAFRSLSPEERTRVMLDVIGLGAAMIDESPHREAMLRLRLMKRNGRELEGIDRTSWHLK